MAFFWVSDDGREQYVEAGDPQGRPLDFTCFPSIVSPRLLSHWTLAQLSLHPSIFNRHIGIYDAGSVQSFGKTETMVRRE